MSNSGSSSESDSDFIVSEENDIPELNGAKKINPAYTRGQLVYLFNHPEDPAELAVLRLICMKWGLQSWDNMLIYLPWRTRASLRTTLCRILKKQALSEYGGIKADPFKIQEDNSFLREGDSNSEYKMKAGMLVNLRWNRSKEDRNKIQEENARKYKISEQEAEKIEIPIIISLEFMRQQLEHRRNSVILYRAAIINEMMNRNIYEGKDLQVNEFLILPAEKLCLPKTALICKVEFPSPYVEIGSSTDDV
ncbi:hypothetical protein M9Y10_011998 [Tritrichomonas musculus]|uniref:Uncharacterized protein n=1 Tax=Tritrichomonas musculus TaxID=1915356 RepID=A0ABR2IBB8_9EUKA